MRSNDKNSTCIIPQILQVLPASGNFRDVHQFIDLLQETAELFNVNVAAFCLMPTHYHLMVQTPDANLSRCMRHLNGIYTKKDNVVHGSDGTLFRGRYKSILVDADSYVLQLVKPIQFRQQCGYTRKYKAAKG